MTSKAGWECFDDSDDEYEEQNEMTQKIGIIVSELLQAFPSSPNAHGIDRILPPTACVRASFDLQSLIQQQLADAGWNLLNDVSNQVDVLIDLDAFESDERNSVEIAKKLHDQVFPGCLVITQILPSVPIEWSSELWSSSRVLSSVFDASTHQLFALTRRSGVANPLHYRVDPPTPIALDIERQWIDSVTIPLTYNERLHGALRVDSHNRAVSILREYGVVILRGVMCPTTVRKWAAAALDDFSAVADKLLHHHDMDVFNPGDKPPSRNFVEFATREAFRCDLRHTPGLTALRSTYPVDPNDRESKEIHPRHPLILSILEDVAQPDGGPLNTGNYGMWNFSFGGPGNRVPLINGDVGAIISTPGCYNQKIHADIPHLFNTVDTPPHLLHVFLPACDEGGFEAGQTAFVLGSHRLATCASMMADDGSGLDETINKTIRPHLSPGDVVIFDCRVLHLGLANTTAPLGSKSHGVRRPILYINWHAPWFEDKKNWEADSLFDSQIE